MHFDVKTGFYDVIHINRVMSYKLKCCHFLLHGIKNKAPRTVTAFGASCFTVILLYLRVFQLGRVLFQPERIAKVFNLGEYGYFLASIDFVGTKSHMEISHRICILCLVMEQCPANAAAIQKTE